VLIIDPLDVWWGLRLEPRRRAPSKFKPVIFGGPHGDLPLNERSGALLGETCAKMRESCIVSLADFKSAAAERRFMLDFLAALYRHASGEPVHLVRRGGPVGAAGDPRQGRRRREAPGPDADDRPARPDEGLHPLADHPAAGRISKGVLSQVDGLVAFKLTASQDRGRDRRVDQGPGRR
jgi:hypothetical protein